LHVQGSTRWNRKKKGLDRMNFMQLNVISYSDRL
jgi:hypothetical protein